MIWGGVHLEAGCTNPARSCGPYRLEVWEEVGKTSRLLLYLAAILCLAAVLQKQEGSHVSWMSCLGSSSNWDGHLWLHTASSSSAGQWVKKAEANSLFPQCPLLSTSLHTPKFRANPTRLPAPQKPQKPQQTSPDLVG